MSVAQFKRSDLSLEHPADSKCPMCESTNTNVANFPGDRVQAMICNDCGMSSEVDWSQ